MSLALYGEALLTRDADVLVRSDDGSAQVLPAARWSAAVDAVDSRVIARLDGPTLDIGCGPGRLVAELAARGLPVLGIDIAPTAVTMTRNRGGSALLLDVFGRVPGAGRWPWAVLLDGNVGIGGAPQRLLRRTAQLLASHGTVIVEVDLPGTRCRQQRVRLETSSRTGPWFPWAWVSADCIAGLATASGLTTSSVWQDEGRCFAELSRA